VLSAEINKAHLQNKNLKNSYGRTRFSGDEFNEFLKELIDNKRLDPPADGISKLVIDQRPCETLSEKQKLYI